MHIMAPPFGNPIISVEDTKLLLLDLQFSISESDGKLFDSFLLELAVGAKSLTSAADMYDPRASFTILLILSSVRRLFQNLSHRVVDVNREF